MRIIANAYIVLILTTMYFNAHAQKNSTINGYVQDGLSGENLPGASLYLPQYNRTLTSNKYGFFSIVVAAGTVQLEISYVGYEKKRITVTARRDTSIIVLLEPQTNDLEEVVVKSPPPTKDSHHESLMGRFTIPMELVKKTPALLGENDLLKTLQLLPGVQAGSEGTVGLNVRGSTPDHNLVLLDGIPVYNINHLFGFLSVINSDAVANAEFLKGSMPARYGGRLGSVLDIRLKEGNLKKWHTNIGLSPVSSKLTIEGPLVKDKSSVLFSVRRTWLDALLKAGQKIAKSDGLNTIGFYDLNAKWNYILSRKDRVYASFYAGQDKFQNSFKLGQSNYSYGFNWGNQTFGLRWNHLFSQKLFSNLSLSYTHFSYKLEDKYESNVSFLNKVSSGIKDLALRYEFDYFPSDKHDIKYGAGLIRHQFNPEIKQFKTTDFDTLVAPAKSIQTFEGFAYFEDDITVNESVKVNAGVYYANQFVNGAFYQSLQPRFSARVLLGETSSLKASYNRTVQYLHLLTNSSAGLPTDLWVPVTARIAPENSNSWSLGYTVSPNSMYNFSVEGYYKTLNNVLEYKEGTNFLNDPDLSWEDRVSMGRAKSYGVEFFVEKTKGKTTGWLSYTLSKTDRIFTDINGGNPFPFKYDRRHNAALNFSYDFKPTKSLSCTFIYTTGMAVNLAAGRFSGFLPGEDFFNQQGVNSGWFDIFNNLPDYNGRNSFRAPSYHRLDISYKTSKIKRHGKRTWILGVYNLYSRQNPFFLFYDQRQLLQVSLLPIIPSFTYSREF